MVTVEKKKANDKTGCEKVILTRMYDVGSRNPSFEKVETKRRSRPLIFLEDCKEMSG